MEKKDKSKRKTYMAVADLSTMGIAMVLAIILGLAAGLYIDSRLGTEPIFTLLFILMGILAGFRMMYRTYMRFFKDNNVDKTDK